LKTLISGIDDGEKIDLFEPTSGMACLSIKPEMNDFSIGIDRVLVVIAIWLADPGLS
jgi:hypothetical protein